MDRHNHYLCKRHRQQPDRVAPQSKLGAASY
jgi:hypothetical protein